MARSEKTEVMRATAQIQIMIIFVDIGMHAVVREDWEKV